MVEHVLDMPEALDSIPSTNTEKHQWGRGTGHGGRGRCGIYRRTYGMVPHSHTLESTPAIVLSSKVGDHTPSPLFLSPASLHFPSLSWNLVHCYEVSPSAKISGIAANSD
jgi:hypothetical protein